MANTGKSPPPKPPVFEDLGQDLAKILESQYEILGLVGQGGMALVYKARDRLLDRIDAVKVLPRELTREKRLVEQFLHEAKLAARLHHPNIVTIYAVHQKDDLNYMVMQYVNGHTLSQLLAQRKRLSGPEALRVARDVCQALRVAHREGIIHRDIKPDNIIVDVGGTAVVTDFGIARALGGSRLFPAEALLGTGSYMAPEQIKGFVDPRSDIYSLGVVMYKMVTGRAPFDGSDIYEVSYRHLEEPVVRPRELQPDVPEVVENIILKCLDKAPEKRYQTAGQMLTALDEALARLDQPEEDVESAVAVPEIPGEVRVDKLQRRAKLAFYEEQYEKAAILLEKILAADPKRNDARELLRQTKLAITKRKRVKELWSSAQDQHKQGNETGATVALQELLKLDDAHDGARTLLSRIEARGIEAKRLEQVQELLLNRDFSKAISNLEEILRAHKGLTHAESLLAEAKRRAAEAVRIDRLYEAGFTCYIQGQYAEAITHWEKILELDPSFRDAREFIAAANRKLSLQRRISALETEARAADKSSDTQRSAKLWRELLELDPSSKTAREACERLDREIKKQRHMDKKPIEPEGINETLARLRELEKLALAAGASATVPEGDSKRPSAAKSLPPRQYQLRKQGIRLANQGRYSAAVAAWLEALELPEHFQAFVGYIEKTLPRIADEQDRAEKEHDYAERLITLGLTNHAIAVWERLLARQPGFFPAAARLNSIKQAPPSGKAPTPAPQLEEATVADQGTAGITQTPTGGIPSSPGEHAGAILSDLAGFQPTPVDAMADTLAEDVLAEAEFDTSADMTPSEPLFSPPPPKAPPALAPQPLTEDTLGAIAQPAPVPVAAPIPDVKEPPAPLAPPSPEAAVPVRKRWPVIVAIVAALAVIGGIVAWQIQVRAEAARVAAIYDRGLQQQSEGQYQEALVTARQILAEKPGHAGAARLAADAEQQMIRQREEAERQTQIASLLERGIEAYYARHYLSCRDLMNEVLRIDANNANAQNYLRLLQTELGAVTELETGASDETIIRKLIEEDRLATASEQLETLIAKDPSNSTFQSLRREVQQRSQQKVEEQERQRQLDKLLADARAAATAEDLGRALNILQQLLALAPAHEAAITLRDDIAPRHREMMAKQAEEAEKVVAVAEAREAMQAGDYPRAIAVLNKAKQADPSNREVVALLQRAQQAYIGQEREKQKQRRVESALAEAQQLASKNQVREALIVLNAARDQDPSNQRIQDQIAALQKRLDKEDTQPPDIVIQPPGMAREGQAFDIRARVFDPQGVKNVRLSFRGKGTASFSELAMTETETSAGVYSAQIPASAVSREGLEIQISAEDTNGNAVATSIQTYSVSATKTMPSIY